MVQVKLELNLKLEHKISFSVERSERLTEPDSRNTTFQINIFGMQSARASFLSGEGVS